MPQLPERGGGYTPAQHFETDGKGRANLVLRRIVLSQFALEKDSKIVSGQKRDGLPDKFYDSGGGLSHSKINCLFILLLDMSHHND
jgi:hypothetical protein